MAQFEDENDSKALVEQKQALSNYLDALFRELPVIEPEPIATPVADEVVVAKVAATDLPKEPVVASSEEVTAQAAENEEPVPVYFQPTAPFQVLFFSLGKLNLAVPLEHLSGVLKVADEKVTPIPGYAEWHLGLMKYHGATVSVIDTAKLIMPAHRQDVVQDQRKYRYFILLGERRWGLGCHAIAEVVKLDPGEVKWRKSRTLQPWLAGTVINKMCALIDVDGFLKLLSKGYL